MGNLTQQQIEALIQFIDGAEDPATVTNTIVAAVLAFLADKTAGMATVQALLEEIATRQTADTDLLSRINQLQQLIQSIGAVIYLDSMGEELDGRPVHIDPGMVIYDPNNLTIKKCTAPDTYVDIGCDENVLYCNKASNILYRWQPKAYSMLKIGGGGAAINVVNNLTEGGTEVALSAEQGKKLRSAMLTLIDAIAPIAFAGTTPTADDLGLNATRYTVQLSLSTGIASSNASTGVYEGGTYSTVISAEDGYRLDTVAVTHNGTAVPVTIANNQATVSIPAVAGAIKIAATATEIVTHSITANLTNCSLDNTTSIPHGESYTGQLTASTGFSMASVSVTMGGNDITSTAYDSTTGEITIQSVTGNVVITAAAVDPSNVAYKGVRFFPNSGLDGKLQKIMAVGTVENLPYVISPLIDLANYPNEKITFSVGEVTSNCGLIYFNEQFKQLTYHGATSVDREVTPPSARYARLVMTTSNMSSSYVDIGEERVFDGSILDLANIADGEAFLNSQYCEQPNENGDLVGWGYQLPERLGADSYPLQAIAFGAYTNSRSARSMYGVLVTEIGVTNQGYIPWVIGKKVTLHETGDTTAISFIFSGGVKQTYAPYLKLYPQNSYSFYDTASASPRTQNISADWTHGRMVCPLERYQNGECFIKNDSTQEVLWENPKTE